MAAVTISIPDGKLAEFKVGFLAKCPVPIDEDGKPLFTEGQWIKEWIKRDLLRAYRHGKHQLATEAAQIDTEVID